MAESKCRGCSERYVGCHSKCEKYKDFKEKSKEEYLQRLKKHVPYYSMSNAMCSSKAKMYGIVKR